MAATVLIVDDDSAIRTLVRTILEVSTSLACSEAADGVEALELWREQHHDVVVLDQEMPYMTGIEVARGMLELSPDQTVILLSAALDHRILDTAERIGVCAALDKYRIEALARVVEDAAGLTARRRAVAASL